MVKALRDGADTITNMKALEDINIVDGLIKEHLSDQLYNQWSYIRNSLKEELGPVNRTGEPTNKAEVIEYLKDHEFNFTLGEFCIEGVENCPDDIAVKIYRHHIVIVQVARVELGIPIIVSDKSGYRSKKWELQRGRSGNGQHTYVTKGAADYRSNSKENTLKLLKWLVENGQYKRIAYYPNEGFIHCDHNADKQQLFIGPAWTHVKTLSKYYD